MIRLRKRITGKKRWKTTTEEAVEKGEVDYRALSIETV